MTLSPQCAANPYPSQSSKPTFVTFLFSKLMIKRKSVPLQKRHNRIRVAVCGSLGDQGGESAQSILMHIYQEQDEQGR